MASQSETNQYINISIDEGGGVYFIPSAPSLWVLSSAILVEFPRSSLGIRTLPCWESADWMSTRALMQALRSLQIEFEARVKSFFSKEVPT